MNFLVFFFTPYLMRTFVHPFLITSALDRFIKKQMHKKKSVATIKCVRYQWLAIYIFLQSNVLQGTCSSNYTDKLNLFILWATSNHYYLCVCGLCHIAHVYPAYAVMYAYVTVFFLIYVFLWWGHWIVSRCCRRTPTNHHSKCIHLFISLLNYGDDC